MELPFLAGVGPNGDPVFESLRVELLEGDNRVRLLRSPLFARNLASGDILRVINADTAEYELEKRSGNLSIRVFRKYEIEKLEEQLTSKLEKLGGELDFSTDRALVYSIHFSIGFQTIEDVLNQTCQSFDESVWYYGNVYDPEDGTTPMEWWLEVEE
jgi:hypothetical protein